MKLEAHSFERFNGGIAVKRAFGSSTVTRFYVYRPEDAKDASKWLIVTAKGRTPGERKTTAIETARAMLRAAELAK